jgi:hypothetical protein
MKNILSFLFVCLLLSCEEPGVEESTLYKSTAPFYAVELNSVFDVYLVQDTAYGVEVTAHQDIIENIKFKLDTGILRIENESRMKWVRPGKNKVKVVIHADRLSALWPTETCYIRTLTPIISDNFQIIMGHNPKLAVIDLDLDSKYFHYWNNHQCGGKVTLRGHSDDAVIQIFGLMTVDAVSLSTNNAFVENNSKGDCKVQVLDKIEYSIRSVGDIHLYGNPGEIIANELTSSGTLIKMD